MPRSALVITTINPPSRALVRLAQQLPDWEIVVVGDEKTPSGWTCEGTTFLSIDDQLAQGFRLARTLPRNHYARKNLGYLFALRRGAPVVAETDDDNDPYPAFLAGVSEEVVARPARGTGWINVYVYFSDRRIWPRGFPLELVNESLREPPEGSSEETPVSCPIQQYLADGDPDVDAVYRLTQEGAVRFRPGTIALGPGAYSPFNSQNTVWWPRAYELLYLPSHATFRMTDIWRSFVALRCLHAAGGSIAFHGPTVWQDRNEHVLLRDFAEEVPGYLHNAELVRVLERVSLPSGASALRGGLRPCYEALVDSGFLPEAELELVDDWLLDVEETRHVTASA